MKKFFQKIKENRSFIAPWIVLGISIIIFATGLTYAYFEFIMDSSDHSSLKVFGADFEMVFTGSTAVTASDLFPIDDEDRVLDAESYTFSYKNNSTRVSACSSFAIEITNISEALLNEGFKWELYNNTTGTSTIGDFSDVYNNRVAMLGNISIPANTTYNYTLRIWLSNLVNVNQSDAMNGTFSGTIIADSVAGECSNVTNFAYTGNYQRFVALQEGYYEIEAWGAQGGSLDVSNSTKNGGKGAHTSGKVFLNQGEQLYIYVGGQGADIVAPGSLTISRWAPIMGGYNGGGSGIDELDSANPGDNDTGTSGGGATDIRLVGGAWDNATSLNSRIMVAAGGSGAFNINGVAYSGDDAAKLIGKHATQLGGGLFGKGIDGIFSTACGDFGITGGGGGYYGGNMYTESMICENNIYKVSTGGTSFISGFAGSAAILQGSVTEPRDHTDANLKIDTLHYSGKYFVDGDMEAGVNSGNGRASITYLGSSLPRVNANLINVRYIKDCINGSTVNSSNHWVELQAIANGANVAKGKVGRLYNSSNDIVGPHATNHFGYITDGNIPSTKYSMGEQYTGKQCFVIDLGQEYNLDEVAVWHYWADGRTYNENITSVAGNNGRYRTVINAPGAETSQGKRVNAYIPISLLSVNLGGGTTTQVFEPSYPSGTTILLTEPTKANNAFGGWRVTGAGASIDGNTLTIGSNLTTITAIFNPLRSLTVNLNDGTTTQVFEPSYISGTEIILTPPTKANYAFDSWSVTGTGSFIDENVLTIGTGATTITAIFNPLRSLTVNLNDGTTTQVFQPGYISGTILTLTVPTKIGYIFSGWSVSGTGASVNNTTNKLTFGTGSVTLTANWGDLYTYTGTSTFEIGDDNWKIKFLTGGDFTPLTDMTIDVFLVGGGGAGANVTWSDIYGAGGGGGYTETYTQIPLTAGTPYPIVIGAGSGISGTAGASTAFGRSADGGTTPAWNSQIGGAGGSAGGNGREAGASDGGSTTGGVGQGSTTREFGEAGGTLYAGGGGGAKNYAGGAGGGGRGTLGSGSASGNPGQSGTANTGGGGGGGWAADGKVWSPGAGGSGIVVIRGAS